MSHSADRPADRNAGRPWLKFAGTIDELSGDARRLHDERLVGGQVWSGAQVLSTIPDHYVKLVALVTAVRDPQQADVQRLSMRERLMMIVIVGSLTRCTHCLARNMADLRKFSGDNGWTETIAMNWRHAGLGGRDLALAELAEKMTLRPDLLAEEDVDALRAVGMADDAIFEAMEVVAVYNMTTRLLNATGAYGESEFFEMNRG
jgi:uncharacterized peroxidase-related enzyme